MTIHSCMTPWEPLMTQGFPGVPFVVDFVAELRQKGEGEGRRGEAPSLVSRSLYSRHLLLLLSLEAEE
jgi:hypothetical protein